MIININKNIEKICRLCLKIIYNDSFEVLDEAVKENLVRILDLDYSLSKTPIICNNCVQNLVKCSEFKSSSTGSKDGLGNLFHMENYREPVNEDQSVEKSFSKNVSCCFCMTYTGTTYFRLLKEEVNEDIFFKMLNIFFPEQNLNVTSESLICEVCLDSLQDYFNFIVKCLETEKKIKKFCGGEGVCNLNEVVLNNMVYFKLSSVLSEMEKAQPNIDIKSNDILNSENPNVDAVKQLETVTLKHNIFAEEDVEFNSSSDNLIVNFGVSNIKEEPAESQDELQKIEKAFVVAENVIVKTETEPNHANEANNLQFDSGNLMDGISVEGFSDTNENMALMGEIDNEHLIETVNDINLSHEDGLSHDDNSESHETLKKGKGRRSRKGKSEIGIQKCKMCPFETNFRSCLVQHLRTHRSDPKDLSFRCRTCDFKTRYKHVLNRHSLLHKKPSELEIYRCEVCSYGTKYKSYIASHMLVHKSPSEIEMHKCDLCPYETKRKELLNRHILSHKSPGEIVMFQCDLCDFKGKQKSYLKRHRLVHTDAEEQKFKCALCPYQTKHKQCLRRHVVLHRDPATVTMFKCGECVYETRHKEQLRRHERWHKHSSEVMNVINV